MKNGYNIEYTKNDGDIDVHQKGENFDCYPAALKFIDALDFATHRHARISYFKDGWHVDVWSKNVNKTTSPAEHLRWNKEHLINFPNPKGKSEKANYINTVRKVAFLERYEENKMLEDEKMMIEFDLDADDLIGIDKQGRGGSLPPNTYKGKGGWKMKKEVIKFRKDKHFRTIYYSKTTKKMVEKIRKKGMIINSFIERAIHSSYFAEFGTDEL